MSTQDNIQTDTPVRVLVIGAGPAGLINARTLIDDGFSVTMVAKESTVGGCWANTYPNLTTNSPWGAFTFSGLDMPKPSNWDGAVVPARTYQRYLEDFYEWFVKDKVQIHFKTEVVTLSPRPDGARGWDVLLKNENGQTKASFDMVVIAAGFLGKPRLPPILESSPITVYHSSELAFPQPLERLLDAVSASSEEPTLQGDAETILVVGGGKSGMDIAALLANRGRKVIWSFKGPLKWFAPTVAPGMLGANRLDILMGPSRIIDSWPMWFFHCTRYGAKSVKAFWTMVGGFWKTQYNESIPAPDTDPFIALPHFAGGISSRPTDFIPLVNAGKIAVMTNGTLSSISSDSVIYSTPHGERVVRCGAIVAATGYKGGMYDFIDGDVRRELGLEREPPAEGWENRVKTMRNRWTTISTPPGFQDKQVYQSMVFRGLLPVGRFTQKDLAVVGGTRPFSIPAITYEVESHWISSLFKDDPFMRLAKTKQELIEEINTDNEYNIARYPGIDPYVSLFRFVFLNVFLCFCHSVILSFCHSVILSFCHSVILSFYHSGCFASTSISVVVRTNSNT
ncbi:hypothetical protein BCR39DRAFT_517622 [Naematelia encephala]|uniref:FAD/NAD(P)-binding domain-containing protein n=1 Tax=Naematelia encephala TaxID=71784 RepID=A0A1Y2BHP1_9TREE|nr:hypothetical protein BCR39DRAFT_517622 [Naematelia encephala]